MAKKRKLTSKSNANTQTLQQQSKQEEEHHVDEEEVEEDEENPYDDEEEEEDEEDEDEEDDNDGEEGSNQGGDDDDDQEPIQNLLEPFSKDQLIHILKEAAEKHADVASHIRKVADEDTVHRKIFVHGLGWDSTAETLRNAFTQYGEIEDCKAVADKVSGKSKGYGFILFKSRSGARKALKEPQKKIGNRMTSCQLAAVGPVPASAATVQQQPVSEYTQRKIFVSNVSPELDPQKVTAFFAKYGEIEEGPLGLDKQTGKPKGFCLFVYKSIDSAKKALAEPHKTFEGHMLHVQRAIDGPKPGKQHQNQHKNPHYGRHDNPNLAGAIGGTPATGAGLMGQSLAFNQGGAAAQALNPALGQALTALLASQGAGLGLNNLLGTLGAVTPTVAGASHGYQGGYGTQGYASNMNPSSVGGYASQAGLQGAYPNQQMGQGSSGKAQHGVGHMGGAAQ